VTAARYLYVAMALSLFALVATDPNPVDTALYAAIAVCSAVLLAAHRIVTAMDANAMFLSRVLQILDQEDQ